MRRLPVFLLPALMPLASLGATLPSLSLERIVSLALENAPVLKSERAQVASEKNQLEQAGAWPNPTLALDGGRVANDSLSQFEGPIYEAALSQTIPFPGKRGARQDAAAAQLKTAESSLAERLLRTQHEAVVLAYRLAALSHLVKHIEDRKARFALVRTYLRSRSFASPVQEVEKDLIELRLSSLEEHLAQRESDYQSAWLELNQLIEQPAPVDPQVRWWKSPKVVNAQDSMQVAEQKNPQLERARYSLDRAQAELRQGRLSIWPDFSLGFGYRREGPQSNGTSFYTGSLAVSLPLWDRGQHLGPALEQAAQAQHWKVESQRRLLQSELGRAAVHLEKARKSILLFALDRAASARKAFDRAEMEFRRGRLPITAFFEIESQSHEMLDRVYEVQAEYAQALSEYLLLTADKMPLEPQDG
jgi:outer membrane protein, heavy metal efflux system